MSEWQSCRLGCGTGVSFFWMMISKETGHLHCVSVIIFLGVHVEVRSASGRSGLLNRAFGDRGTRRQPVA